MSDFENPYAQQDPQPNPYAPAVISSAHPSMGSESEQIRSIYLSHEASVKSIWVLYLLGAIVGVIVSAGTLFYSFSSGISGQKFFLSLITPTLYILFSILLVTISFGIRRLSPWARIATAGVSGIGLIGFPVGTLISGYILYLLLCGKGKMVFSPEYKTVIQETPHLKYKTSIAVWVLLGLLIAVALCGIVSFVFVG